MINWRLSFSLFLLLSLSFSQLSFSAEIPNSLLAQLGDSKIATLSLAQLNSVGSANSNSQDEVEIEYSKQLIGLFVNGIEQPAITAVYGAEQYLLPLVTVLDSTASSINTDDGSVIERGILINTPGGDAVLFPEDLMVVDNQVMITQTALAEKMLVDVRFDQSRFALYLALPWSLTGSRQVADVKLPEAQFLPPVASLRNLRADLNYFNNDIEEGLYGDYFAAGNLSGGSWQIRMEQDEEGDLSPLEYYWAKDFGKSQALFGNANFSLHPLLPTVEQTGVQFLYSTSHLLTSGNSNIARAYGNKAISNGVRNISGVATPGSIAELRVDGGVIARTRVRLNGSYDFPNVELPTRGYSEVNVMVLDRYSGVLLETQDFSRRSGIELLNKGQHSFFGTLGEQGNSFDDRFVTQGDASAVQWRYGLTEDLTVELGRQQVGDISGSEASVSMAFFNHWFGSLGYAEGFDRDAFELDLEGGNELWRFDFIAREFENKNPLGSEAADQNVREWSRSLNYRFQLTQNLNLGVVGRDTNTSYEEKRFVLPSVGWSNNRNFSVNAWPNISGSYRVDTRFTPTYRDTARYAYEHDSHLFDYRHRNDNGQEYYANYRTGEEQNDRFEFGMVHYSENQGLGRARIGIVSNGGSIGYALDWESKIFPGLNSRFRLSKGDQHDRFETDNDDELFLQWQMTLDFAVAQKRIVPADSHFGSLSSAALSGELLLDGKRIPSHYEINRIELLIDGDSRTVSVQSGRYYVDGLKPGLHKVSIDSKYLPIELMPKADQSFWVRLESSAATEVPLALEVRFAIAGRVQDANGVNLVNERLLIFDDRRRVVGEAYTDQYGLYRADNLAPGSYNVAVDRDGEFVAAINITVTNDFLFEQDLVVP